MLGQRRRRWATIKTTLVQRMPLAMCIEKNISANVREKNDQCGQKMISM